MAKKYYDSDKGSRMGSGDFAGMPQDKVMKEYPKSGYGYGMGPDDTIKGIDETNRESYKKRGRYISDQK